MGGREAASFLGAGSWLGLADHIFNLLVFTDFSGHSRFRRSPCDLAGYGMRVGSFSAMGVFLLC
jgi:hypothetical protein